jgi:predicted dehydrogenase
LGTGGRLTLNRPFVSLNDGTRKMVFHPADGEPEEISVPEKPLYLGEVEDMHAAILDGAPNYLTLAETRDHVRTVLALYESAQKGQVVQLKRSPGLR